MYKKALGEGGIMDADVRTCCTRPGTSGSLPRNGYLHTVHGHSEHGISRMYEAK
jgi:hypothetical protein